MKYIHVLMTDNHTPIAAFESPEVAAKVANRMNKNDYHVLNVCTAVSVPLLLPSEGDDVVLIDSSDSSADAEVIDLPPVTLSEGETDGAE